MTFIERRVSRTKMEICNFFTGPRVDLRQEQDSCLSIQDTHTYEFKFRRARSQGRVDREASEHDVDERGPEPTKNHSTGPIITNPRFVLSWP